MPDLEEIKKMEEVYTAPKNKKVKIEFVHLAPEAKKVSLAGSFNDWDTKSLPMKKNRHGQWKVTVDLVPGRYEYKYFADNSWVKDLQCDEIAVNSFGSTNCVINVAPKMAA